MPEQVSHSQPSHRWYTRPVLFVRDVHRAVGFYVGLGFVKRWHSEDGAGGVCQVDRGECQIILCQDDARGGKGRLFIELTGEAFADFRREISERSVPNKDSWWGSDVVQIQDPDGNDLLFPYSTRPDIESR